MNSPWLEQLGNWNPQILREFRGRLKQRSLIAAVAISLIVQALILLIFLESNESPQPRHWAALWTGLSTTFPYLLICVGGYYLVSNLTQEEKSGTLNFIRLSPRPAWQILLGKLLGVPILPAIAFLSFLPLHLIAGILGQVPLLLMLSFYLMLGVGCVLTWSFSILFGLVGSHRSGLVGQGTTLAIVYVATSLIFLVPFWYYWNTIITWRPLTLEGSVFASPVNIDVLEWYWLPLNQNLFISHGFTIAHCCVILFLTWRIMLRRFRRPRSTLLSRRQSYGIMAYILLSVLGFFLSTDALSAQNAESWNGSDFDFFQATALGVMLFLTYILSLLLMGATCPGRQSLLEWSRQPNQGILGLIWADKSPAILSYAILLVIANLILLPMIILLPARFDTSQGNLTLLLLIVILGVSSTLMMIGTFMQYVFTLKLRNPAIWFGGSLLLWWVVPPIVLGILEVSTSDISPMVMVWAFFGYPLGQMVANENIPMVLFGIFVQWGVIAGLMKCIQGSLYEFKTLGNQA